MDASPFVNGTSPLQFRGIPDALAESHLEGSECCLIHTDNPASGDKGVWLNADVRVGYNRGAYEAVHPSDGRPWVSLSTIFWGSWSNRIRRWTTFTWFKESVVRRRLASWLAKEPGNAESGVACLINEMQVLRESGWAHV